VPFDDPVFITLLEQRCEGDSRKTVTEAHRLAQEYLHRSIPAAERKLGADFGELRSRASRIAYMRAGRRLAKLVSIPISSHPIGYRSESVFIADLDQEVDGDATGASREYGRFLMTTDTERTKIVNRMEMMRTYAAVAEDQLRMLLVAGDSELRLLLAQINHLRYTVTADLMDLDVGYNYYKKLRVETRQQLVKAEEELKAAEVALVASVPGGLLRMADEHPLKLTVRMRGVRALAEYEYDGDAAEGVAAAPADSDDEMGTSMEASSDDDDEDYEEDVPLRHKRARVAYYAA